MWGRAAARPYIVIYGKIKIMISTLRGEVSQIEDNAIIVEVGGVGLRVFVPAPLRTRLKAGDGLMLFRREKE